MWVWGRGHSEAEGLREVKVRNEGKEMVSDAIPKLNLICTSFKELTIGY